MMLSFIKLKKKRGIIMRRQIQMDVIFLFKSQEYKLKLATICISISYLLIQHEIKEEEVA